MAGQLPPWSPHPMAASIQCAGSIRSGDSHLRDLGTDAETSLGGGAWQVARTAWQVGKMCKSLKWLDLGFLGSAGL